MTKYWEFDVFAYIAIALILLGIACVVLAWWQDRQRWKGVSPYYGRPYDASSKPYRANVDLRRVR